MARLIRSFDKAIRTDAFLFLSIVSSQGLILWLLYLLKRIPSGHDGFEYLQLQYVFLNSATSTGEIPQWMPFMTQGSVATWWYAIQAAPLQSALLLVAPLFERVPFLATYYTGIFVDLLFLATGMWLLGRRLFSSKITLVFVTATALLSTVWYSQPWYSLHFFYCVPLNLYFLHRLLDTGKLRFLWLAGSLFILQIFGDLPYLLVMVSFIVSLYVVTYIVLNFETHRTILIKLARDWRAFAVLGCLALLLVAAFALLTQGTNDIVFDARTLRNPDGTVTPNVFLHYVETLALENWMEIGLGTASGFDYSLYVGYLALPLALVSVLAIRRRNIHIWLVMTVLIGIAMAMPFSMAIYYLWPGGRYFRHLTLVVCFLPIFACLAIGFGLDHLVSGAAGEWVFREKIGARPLLRVDTWRTILAGFCGLLVIGFCLVWLRATPWATEHLVQALKASDRNALPPVDYRTFPAPQVEGRDILRVTRFAERLDRSWIFALAGAGILFGIWKSRNTRRLKTWLAAACMLQVMDIYTYQMWESVPRTSPLNAKTEAALGYQPIPYRPRRTDNIFADRSNERFAAFLESYPFAGATYWTGYPFFFADSTSSQFRVDSWAKPLDDLIHAYRKNPPELDLANLPTRPRPPINGLNFPDGNAVAAKLSGLTEDKVQFFSAAHTVADPPAAIAAIGDPHYLGDTLVLLPRAQPPHADAAPRELPEAVLSANERIYLRYKVTRYESDRVDIEVDNTSGKARWLYYSEVWHQGWRATVNGEPVDVMRANVAYKAVELHPGTNIIIFRFGSQLVTWLRRGVGVLAWFWLGAIAYFAWVSATGGESGVAFAPGEKKVRQGANLATRTRRR